MVATHSSSPVARTARRSAQLAGLAGLIPFLVALGVAWFHPPWAGFALQVQTLYGAVILSFLGGIYWGLALTRAAAGWFWISVLPSLWGWGALLLPHAIMPFVLAAGFVLTFAIDRAAARAGWIEPWFLHLRLVLGGTAIASLALAGLV